MSDVSRSPRRSSPVGLSHDVARFGERLSRLTPRQKDCLRLVAFGQQSKSVARELGISPLRVDKHISDARKILGVSDRGEAARLLNLWEQQDSGTDDLEPWGAPSLGLLIDGDPLFMPMADDGLEIPWEANAPTLPKIGERLWHGIGGREVLRQRSAGTGRKIAGALGIPWPLALLIFCSAITVAAGAVASLLLSLGQLPR